MRHSFTRNGHLWHSTTEGLSRLPTLESLPRYADTVSQRSALILRLLREKAQQNRNKKRVPFYSIRAVASHFAVPSTTVSRIYGRLRDEGLLVSVWGSKTFVEPREINKALRVRAVIALPVSMTSFCTVRNYRAFFLSICDTLWRFGFATQLVFYEGRYSEDPSFAERLLSHKADIVIWYLPDANLNGTAASFTDRGMRLVTVGDSSDSSRRHGYYVSRRQAIKEGLAAWRRDGIASVTVARSAGCPSIRECGTRLHMIEACLCEVGIPHTFATIKRGAYHDGLHASPRHKNSAVIFPSSEFAVQFASQDRARFGRLTNHSRVMLVEGPVDFPGLDPNGMIDLVDIDWELPARQISRDLVNQVTSRKVEPVTFDAQWCPRTSISGNSHKV